LGKGISETNLGQALIRAAEVYSKQPYRGNRVVLLVSDGGEKLMQDAKNLISSQFKKQKLSLYWIYLRSVDGMTLEETEGEVDQWKDRPERKLHQFFNGLSIPYQVFEAGSHEQISDAFSDINEGQLLPLIVNRIIPK
jgi:mxaC protein